MQFDSRLVRVAKIFTLKDGQQTTNATGFFFMRDAYLYVITNRHVVCDEPNDHRPDGLRLQVHSNPDDLKQIGQLDLPLYDDSGRRMWREHAELGANADVVAVPVNDPRVTEQWFVDWFTPEDLLPETDTLPLGQVVSIVGFPLGFEDTTHHMPMVRNATIASVYPLNFQGNRQFLTDARMHRGASGSPVIARLAKLGSENRSWFLLGVHSASLDVSDRDPNQDEKLGLNIAWYASLVEELTRPPK